VNILIYIGVDEVLIVWILLVFFILIIKVLMGDLISKEKQKNFLVISGIAITLIMGLRYPKYNTVYDLELYYRYYYRLIYTPWTDIFLISRFEPGYVILNKILATIIPWPQFILIFEAAFCVFCVCRFIYKNSDYPFQSIIFYITLGTMAFQLTGFRQAFAMSICLLSIEFIKEKKLFKFLLTVFLATTFHKTSIVFFPFYFIANRVPNWKNNLFSIIAMIFFANFARIITDIGNVIFDMDYGGYIGNKYGGLVPILIYTITIILSFIYSNKIKNKGSLNMLVIGLTIYLMRYTTLALERISFFYTSAVIVQLPNAINVEKDEKIKYLLNILSIVLSIILFVYRLTKEPYGAYSFFWQ